MGKKRIHEIAKDLGFQNRDLIEKLQKLGFEVKTHSSTVDEDDVRAALKNADDERRARTDEKRLSKRVIRRRPKDGSSGVVIRRRAAAPPVEAAPEDKPEEVAATLEPDVADAAEDQVAASATPVDDTPTDEAVTEEPATQVAEGADSAEALSADAAEPVAAEPEEDEAAKKAAAEEEARKEKESKEARLARPEPKRREEEVDEADEKPEAEDIIFSESDFMGSGNNNAEARVAPPPPSAAPVSKTRDDEGASKVVRRIDPAVLRARLASAKRPEPPKEWGRQTPPNVAASPVTELVVRTDASGKRRELVDVRKEAARNRGGRAGQKRREEMSAKDLLEHRRGQVYYPSPTRRRVKGKGRASPVRRSETQTVIPKKPVEIGETTTPAEMAKQMPTVKANDLIRRFMAQGVMAGMNHPVEHEVAALICMELGYEVSSKVFDEEARLEGRSADEVKVAQQEDPDATSRAPVVTVMGHVDHGKTSLLDKIRNANVVAGEAGGITQAIAGYQVKTSKGLITFLDTPGHKAFSAMRSRGANITDIVILVVAADDGVMPQTQEAIRHAKSADVPIVVAINKMDKPDANPDKVLQELAGHGVQVEDWGGDVLCRRISALKGTGIEDLLEQVALQAEIMELKANANVSAVGRVIEAEVHKGRGPVATVLVQEGTLSVGDAVIVGEAVGKVRALMADTGKRIKTAGPSIPVQILGLDSVPEPGDELRVAKSLDDARQLQAHRKEVRRGLEQTGKAKVSLRDFLSRMGEGGQKELRIIIKADVQGSVEALRASLEALTTNQVKVAVVSDGVGAITESDVEFARASGAIIVGFNVRPDTKAIKAARSIGGVDIRTHSVIYEVIDEVHKEMEGRLDAIKKEKYLGRAEVRATFNVPKVGTVAGCYIVDGLLQRNAQIRVLRDSVPIFTGKLASLKRFKDDVREVKEGFECGMGVERFNDLKVGDLIEAFEVIEVKAVLNDRADARPQPHG